MAQHYCAEFALNKRQSSRGKAPNDVLKNGGVLLSTHETIYTSLAGVDSDGEQQGSSIPLRYDVLILDEVRFNSLSGF